MRELLPTPYRRRLVQVSCGWPRAGRVPDLQAPASGGAQVGMQSATPTQGRDDLHANDASAKSRFVHIF